MRPNGTGGSYLNIIVRFIKGPERKYLRELY